MKDRLEKRTYESRLEFDYRENNIRINITYEGDLESKRQDILEMFIRLYDSFRNDRRKNGKQ